MLLDSNIIIYAAQPENEAIRQFIAENSPNVSALSYIEVLGYHRFYFEQFFLVSPILPISTAIIEQATMLRQIRRMTLGDSIIAGTAIIHHLILVTRNTADFSWITEIEVFNPLT